MRAVGTTQTSIVPVSGGIPALALLIHDVLLSSEVLAARSVNTEKLAEINSINFLLELIHSLSRSSQLKEVRLESLRARLLDNRDGCC